MNYEAFCFALGHTVIWGLAWIISWVVVWTAWYYFSTAFALWLVRVLSHRKNPKSGGGTKLAYTRMFLWRTRLLLRMVCDWRMVCRCHGSGVSTSFWEVDLTGILPKVHIR